MHPQYVIEIPLQLMMILIPTYIIAVFYLADDLMEVDDINTCVESTDLASRSLADHVTTPCLPLAPLVPATVSLRAALVSQLRGGAHLSAGHLENLVQYLMRIPGFHLRELGPILMWRYGVCLCQ